MTRQALNRLLAEKQCLENRAATDVALSRRVDALRLWQAERLERTYGALRGQSRFIAALDFFLTHLYGPRDFTRRDADLKRALARLQRALPARMIELLCMALELQVLTLDLDQELAASLETCDITPHTYAAGYRKVGRASDRQRQVDLIVRIGEELGHLVQLPWIRVALRTTHMPSHIAGFGVLQDFLERGFDAFSRLGDPQELLAIIKERETSIMTTIFRGDDAPLDESARNVVNHG